MRKKSLTILFLLAGLLLVPGKWELICAQETDSTATDEQAYIDAHSAYIKGIQQFENEDYREAATSLSQAFSEFPNRSGIAFALADAYLQLGDLSNAIYYARQASGLNPQNKWYHLKLSEIYRASGNIQQLIHTLHNLLKHHPGDSEGLSQLAEAYSQQGDYHKSNEIYNKLLKKNPSKTDVHLKRLENFDRVNMQDSAVVELQLLRKRDPNNLSLIHSLANYYLDLGKTDTAKQMLKKGLAKYERNPQTHIMLADIYMKQAQWDSTGAILEDVLADSLVDAEAKMTLARYMFSSYRQDPGNQNLAEVTSRLINSFTQYENNYSKAHSLAADFYITTEQTDLALKALARTNELQPSADDPWKQRLQLLNRLKRYDQVIQLAPRANDHVPQDPQIYYYWGRALHAGKQHREAIEKLSSAIRLPARKSLKTMIYTSLGDAYTAINQREYAFKSYEQALQVDPQNKEALNNYARSLSVDKQQLDKALQLALQALDISSKHASSHSTYLHTVGWIHYQKGGFQKGLHYLEKSVESGSANAEIMEHLGDVYHKLNSTRKAREWWQKAFEMDSSRTHLKEKLNQEQ